MPIAAYSRLHIAKLSQPPFAQSAADLGARLLHEREELAPLALERRRAVPAHLALQEPHLREAARTSRGARGHGSLWLATLRHNRYCLAHFMEGATPSRSYPALRFNLLAQ